MKSLCTGLTALSLAACDVTLLREIPPEQAERLVRELDRSGIVARAASETGGGTRIEVDPASVPTAVAVLEQRRCELQGPAPAKAAWLETLSAERARQAVVLSRELESSLLRLPSVLEARVHVSMASGPASLPEAQTPAAASVLLVRTASAGSQAQTARELVAGAVPGLAAAAVRVVETERAPAPSPGPQFARVGPITVTQASAPTLRAWLAAALVLQILLAAALLRPLLRRRKD